MVFPILPANTLSGGYDIDNSLRFDEDSDASLGGTFGTPTEAKAFTLSMWFKRAGMMGTIQTLLGPGSFEGITLWSDEKMTMYWDNGNGGFINWAPLLRDHSAWYHFVIAQDTAQGTDTNRVKFYLNGTQITTLGGQTSWPAQDLVGGFNEDGQAFYISTYDASARPVGGYCAEVAFIDGLQYAASNFGETDEDSGIWKPKEFKDDVTFGNNGFYLEFKQSGVGTNASGLGADTSGNDNHLAVSNLAATDQCTDTPTNNFATLNPLDAGSEATLSEGNCKYTGGTTVGQTTIQICGGTFGVSKGKWYYEAKIISNVGLVGIYAAEHPGANIGYTNITAAGWTGKNHIISTSTGIVYNGNTNSAYGSAYDDDDIIGVALDLDNGAIYYSDNGTFADSGDPTSGASKTGAAPIFTTTVETWILPLIGDGGSAAATVCEFNCGNPTFAISSGNADANGYGNFEYAPPSGYYAPCTKNLAEFG